jgi:hypothetical protein
MACAGWQKTLEAQSDKLYRFAPFSLLANKLRPRTVLAAKLIEQGTSVGCRKSEYLTLLNTSPNDTKCDQQVAGRHGPRQVLNPTPQDQK